jgi:hypothetical protein
MEKEGNFIIATFEVTWNLNMEAVSFKFLLGKLLAHGPRVSETVGQVM